MSSGRFKSLRGNAVFRWEHMTGSALYLAWTQERSDVEAFGMSRQACLK